MTASNLVARWQEPTIQTDPVSYKVMELVHNLLATLSATACNITQSSLLSTIITVPATNPSFLISPTIQDATLTIDINVAIQKWCSICQYILTGLIVPASSLTSLLQVSQSVTLSHYLFRSPKKQPPTYEEANQAPDKTPRSKISQSPTNELTCSNHRVPSLAKTSSASMMKVR